jgi:outer membrane protein assembly factor BamB/predicted MPP superfamily phosphohydrolase
MKTTIFKRNLLLGLFLACLPVLQAQTLQFAFLTDLHVEPGTPPELALNKIVDEINEMSLDFVVVTGDLTNTGTNAELESVKSALDKLTIPCHVIPGNHETNWSESAGQHFAKLWGNDRFVEHYKGFTLIGFATGPYMRMGDGLVKQEDLLWLSDQLAKNSSEDQVLLAFSHYPLVEGLSNHYQVSELLKNYHCKAVFCGHGHKAQLMNFNSLTGIMGRALMMKNSGYAGYQIVELKGDSLFVTAKELGQNREKPWLALDFNSPNLPPAEKLPVIASQDETHKVFKPYFSLQDSASVFSGIALLPKGVIVYGNSLGKVKAYNTKTNKVVWEKSGEGTLFSTPVYSQNVVAWGSVNGYVIGVDALTGTERWKINIGKPVIAEGLVENGFLYIGAGDVAFYKISMATGDVVWKFEQINGLVQGKPALKNGDVVFGAWDRHLYCVDKETGLLKWKWNNGKPQKLFSPGNVVPVIANGKVFVVAPDRFMTAIDVKTGNQIWRTNEHQVRESMGLSRDGKLVFAKLMNDSILAVRTDTETFTRDRVINGGFGYEHNPVPIVTSGKAVAFGTRNGKLGVLKLNGKYVIHMLEVGASAINHMVFDGSSRLWFTLAEGKIVGVNLK